MTALKKVLSAILWVLLTFYFSDVTAQTRTTQTWSEEQVVLEDGRRVEYPLYYDASLELLHLKNEKGAVEKLFPEDVISFSYAGELYFSVPFENGKLSFFKVEHEGKDVALLSKANSVNLIQYISSAYVDRYQICPGKGKKGSIQLCEARVRNKIALLNNERMFERQPKQLTVSHCLFIAGEQGLRLFRMEVEKVDLMGKKTRNIYFESLDNLLDPDRLEKAHEFALNSNLDEEKLEELVVILSYYSSL